MAHFQHLLRMIKTPAHSGEARNEPYLYFLSLVWFMLVDREKVLGLAPGSRVLLTLLGGGAFGNEDRWIHSAMQRALMIVSEFELDVRIVSYGTPSRTITQMAEDFGPLAGAPQVGPSAALR